jgi:hypothetical protein
MAPGERMAGAARLAEQEEDDGADAEADSGETPESAGETPEGDSGDEG